MNVHEYKVHTLCHIWAVGQGSYIGANIYSCAKHQHSSTEPSLSCLPAHITRRHGDAFRWHPVHRTRTRALAKPGSQLLRALANPDDVVRGACAVLEREVLMRDAALNKDASVVLGLVDTDHISHRGRGRCQYSTGD